MRISYCLMAARKSSRASRAKPVQLMTSSVAERDVRTGEINNSIVITGNHNHVEVNNAEPQAPVPSTLSARRMYLSRMLRAVERIPHPVIDPDAIPAVSAAKLSDVYTSLFVEPSGATGVYLPAPDIFARVARQPTALERLHTQERLVLLGEAGSGKTSFLNFVAGCLAAACLSLKHRRLNTDSLSSVHSSSESDEGVNTVGVPHPWPHGALLPVHVSLRDFAASGLLPHWDRANAQHLWQYVSSRLHGIELDEFASDLRRTLEEGGALVLLDGIDEVPENDRRRAQVIESIDDFSMVYDGCRFVVTSRRYAYKEGCKLANFSEATLAPFDADNRREFILRWHTSLATGLGRAFADGCARSLDLAIESNGALGGLSERPLLLALMASRHARAGCHLPATRCELYSDVLELTLSRWEDAKAAIRDPAIVQIDQVSHLERMRIDKIAMCALLDEFAWDSLRTADAVRHSGLKDRLRLVVSRAGADLTEVMDYLSARAGVLVSPTVARSELPGSEVPDLYVFSFRAIHHYMAACHLARQDYPETLARWVLAAPDSRGELAYLTAAKATMTWRWDLVDDLCGQEPRSSLSSADLRGALLAAQMLPEAGIGTLPDKYVKRTRRVARCLVQAERWPDLSLDERTQATDLLNKLGRPGGKSLLKLVDRMVQGEPDALVDVPQLYAAIIAANAVAESDVNRREDRYELEVQRMARWMVRAEGGSELSTIERSQATDMLAKFGRPTGESLRKLVNALCVGEPEARSDARQLLGALIVGNAIEQIHAALLPDNYEMEIKRVARWLVRVEGGSELSPSERERARALLANLGDPAGDSLWLLASSLCKEEPADRHDARDVLGALIAGRAIAGIAKRGSISVENEQRVGRIARWLTWAIKHKGLPRQVRHQARHVQSMLGLAGPRSAGLEIPTVATIKQMRDEAAIGGDFSLIETCDRALNGNKDAIKKCARILALARS